MSFDVNEMDDLNYLCFLCLTYNKQEISKEDNYLNMEEELRHFIPQHVLEKSEILKHVCDDCVNTLNNIKKFRKKCLENVVIYNEYVQKLTQESGLHKNLSVTDFLHQRNVNLSSNDELNCSINVKSEKIFDIHEIRSQNLTEVINKDTVIKTEDTFEEDYVKNDITESLEESQSEEIFKEENGIEQVLIKVENEDEICSEIEETVQHSSNKKDQKTGCPTNKYECETCQKTFTQLSNLNSHKFTHSGEKRFTCDVCQIKFVYLSQLRSHERVHTGEKSYKCDVCPKKFTHSSTLRSHKLTHSGDKPHECNVCQKTFTQIGHLRVHKRLHSGEKPYKCDVCPKTFTHASSLKSHQLVHSGEKPYLCDVCQKAFSHIGNLQTHKRVHSGEKPYRCDVCQKTFTISTHLKSHKLVHTGEKPHVCDICQKAFGRIDYLRKHKLTHTGA